MPTRGTATAWRNAARDLARAGVPPEEVDWLYGDTEAGLFAAPALPDLPRTAPLTVPRDFVPLSETVAWHSAPDRFARLYAMLWRLRDAPGLIHDRADPDLAHLRRLEKSVRRDLHKMHAFVRFREIGDPHAPRRRFAAWFEPDHHITEPVAPFFARRFGDMDWIIVTPDLTARFDDGEISFEPGGTKPPLPEDATEELWGTYFRSIFNPARLKVRAMTSEMPRKYWKNLPEAGLIPDMIASAQARSDAMRAAAPTPAPKRAARVLERLHTPRVSPPMTLSFDDLRRKAEEDSRTAREGYGRIVLGEGPPDAALMIVGEQPGDVEDREGRPFVGPAGQVFDREAALAGIDRGAAYVTNAVKQFKFSLRGKRRIHQSPGKGDIEHARWWLDREVELIRPRLILAMGGTAAETLTGTRAGILKRRGRIEETGVGPVFLTVHPSYILRLPDAAAQEAETETFRADLAAAQAHLEELLAA
nr:UdgX family uracil-DNA binding protein [Mesobaculum littorinae]